MKQLVNIVILSSLVTWASSIGPSYYKQNAKHQTFFQIARQVILQHKEEFRQDLDAVTSVLFNDQPYLAAQLSNELIDTMNVLNETRRCEVCQTVVKGFQDLPANAPGILPSQRAVVERVKQLCRKLTGWYDLVSNAVRIRKDLVCDKVIDSNANDIMQVLGNRNTPDKSSVANTSEFCQHLNLCFAALPTNSTESSTLDNYGSPQFYQSASQFTAGNRRSETTGVIKVVQLTDVHIEPNYKNGTTTDCGLPVCCTDDQGQGYAGNFGDYRCNIPQRTIELFLDNVKRMNPDIVLFTGDVPPHSVWDETEAEQTQCTRLLTQSIQRILPGHNVYPCIGNHETFPTNQYSVNRSSSTRNFARDFYTLWQPIANFTAVDNGTIAAGGYYTMLVREGLRVLAFNTNYMYIFNWYNGLNYKYPEVTGMKAFMEKTLSDARNNSEKVIMLGHHPIGDADFIVSYSRWYQSLVHQFSDVIVLQPTGHTHSDGFRLIYDATTRRPVSVVHISPSISSGGTVNPSMRVFHLDNTTFELVDYEQYFMNLSSIRSFPPTSEVPEINLLYSAKSAYDLPDLTPQSWHDFTVRLQTDQNLLMKFIRNTNAAASNDYSCNAKCRWELICHLRNADFDQYNACAEEFQRASLPSLPETTTTQLPSSTSGSTSLGHVTSGFLALSVLLVAVFNFFAVFY